MIILVAGVACLLAFVTGVLSCKAVPFFLEQSNIDGGETPEAVAAPAAKARFFVRENGKQIVFVCAMALLCAIAASLSYFREIRGLDLVRQILVADVLLAVMIIDRHTRKIPNLIVLISLAAGALLLLAEFICCRENFLAALVTSGVGACVCLVLFYILGRLTKDGIGMGDIKLITALGWIMGLGSTIFVVLSAMILCSLFAVVLLLGKKKNKNDSVPFGPFLFFGYIILLLLFSL